MTDDRRQQDFAERLSRISRERGQSITPDGGDAKRDPSDFDYNAPRKRHPVRNTIIWAFILAGLGVGGYYGWNALPQELRDITTNLVISDDDLLDFGTSPDAIPETDVMSDQGPTFASPNVVQVAIDPIDLGLVASQVSLPTDNTTVGTITPIIRNAQCNLRPPQSDEKILGVRLENALLPAPLYALSNEQLADQLLMNVEAVTQEGADPMRDMPLSGRKAVLDIFITDTSAPLYLVLQNMGPGIVWNLHPGPDVNITHVALVGSDFSGVANLPADATIEGLLVSDFVPPHQYGADDTRRECMIRPWRNPQPDWIGTVKSEAGSLVYQNQMYSYAKGYEAYNRWYTEKLGQDAGANTVTIRDAAHVLLGDAPAEPITYRPLAGAEIHLMETDYLYVGDATSRDSAAEKLHNDLLTAAIGGGLSALNPPAMERNSQ